MKYFYSISFILIFSLLLMSCTPSQYSLKKVKIDKVFEVEGKSKNNIYNRTLKWIALNTSWSKSVIDYEDSTAATIIVKANVVAYDYTEKYYIPCIFEINIKDGKINIVISNGYDDNKFEDSDRNSFYNRLFDISVSLAKYVGKDDDF